MPNPIFTQELVVTDTEIDFSGRMTMQALMTCFQNIAGLHASSLGLGFEPLRALDLAWVLVKTCIKIDTPPERGQRIKLTTWPGTTRRCYYYRYYTVEDMAGNRLCACSSVWVIINTKTRDLFFDREGVLSLPIPPGLEPPVELPKRLKFPETPDETLTRRPQYSEIDINQHLNNVKYLAWICDMVGYERFEKFYLSRLYIQYSSEIKPHDTVVLSRYHEDGGELFQGVNKDGQTHFQAQLHWTPLG